MSARYRDPVSHLDRIKLNALEDLITIVKESKELCELCRALNSDRFNRIIERVPSCDGSEDNYVGRYEELKLMITIAKEHRAIRQEFPAHATGQFTKPASRDY